MSPLTSHKQVKLMIHRKGNSKGTYKALVPEDAIIKLYALNHSM